MTTTPTTRTLDELVATYADLQARSQQIADEMNDVKAQIRDGWDVGTYGAAGLKVTIREPNRTLNLDKAVGFLPDEVKPLCQVTSYDRKKVISFLAPAVLDLAYEPGSGNRVVSIA